MIEKEGIGMDDPGADWVEDVRRVAADVGQSRSRRPDRARRGHDVQIVGVGKCQSRHQWLPSGDAPILEGAVHVSEALPEMLGRDAGMNLCDDLQGLVEIRVNHSGR